MNSLFPNGIDLYVLMGSYANPNRFIDGESCKALVPSTSDLSKISGWFPVNYFGNQEWVNNVFVNGPKSRLESEIEKWEPHLQEKIKVFEESRPGGLSVALEDGVQNILSVPKHQRSRYFLVSTTDIIGLNEDMARQIYFDIRTSIRQDINEIGKIREIYYVVGEASAEVETYGKAGNKKLGRKGLIMGPELAIRFGSNFLFDTQILEDKPKEVDKLKEYFGFRKIAENYKETIPFYKTKFIEAGGKDIVTKSSRNWIKRRIPLVPRFFPYDNIPLEDANALISNLLGLDLKLVVSLGSADFDSDKEYNRALKNGN